MFRASSLFFLSNELLLRVVTQAFHVLVAKKTYIDKIGIGFIEFFKIGSSDGYTDTTSRRDDGLGVGRRKTILTCLYITRIR